MENISYVGASQQLALSQQIEVTSNNIANMSTPGFKSKQVLFLDYITQPKNNAPINQSYDYATYRDLSMGNLSQTYNPLDVAIDGKGYFVVQTPEGDTRYTRAGSFSLNDQSQIVDQSGNLVIGDSGSPLVVQSNAKKVTIGSDGKIASEQGDIGKFKVVNFDNEQQLKNIGNNLYDPNGQSEQAVDTPHIEQGVLEGSNVNPLSEMNKMISLMRMFQATQNMLQDDHNRITSAIDKLTTVPT